MDYSRERCKVSTWVSVRMKSWFSNQQLVENTCILSHTMYIICDIATQSECHPHVYISGMSGSIYLIKP
jgi:uncharacterized Zn-finger protein